MELTDLVTAKGGRWHYATAGSGDPLVLLHGWPLTCYSWRKVISTLAERYSVIAPDLPSLGDSGPPTDGYTKDAIARDVRDFVHTLGYRQIRLAGHDMGAPVAYAYARQFQDEVRQLAILDVPLSGFGLDEFARRLHLWHFDFFRSGDLAEKLIEGRERAFIESFYPHYNSAAITPSDVDEYARTYAKPGVLAQSLNYYRTFAADEEWNHQASAVKLEMPVLAIGGEFAGAASPFESMAHLAHNVTGRVLRGCGHYLAEEKPQELTAELLRFFAS